MRQGATWQWTSKHDHAFQDIKHLVAKAPVSKFYDASEELTIECDASQHGLEELGCYKMDNQLPSHHDQRHQQKTGL